MARETDDSEEAGVELAFRRFWEQGSAPALEALLRAHADRAYAQAWHLLGHDGDAQDALQEAFLQLVRKRSHYDGSVPFRSILFHLVYRSAQMVRRARRRRRIREGGPMPSAPAAHEPPPEDPRRELVRSALGSLPERYREPIHLHYVAGFPRDEVARMLGLTIGALDTRLHRGRERLRLLLERQTSGASMAAILPLLLMPVPEPAPSGVLSGIRDLAERVATDAPLPTTHVALPLSSKVLLSMQTHPLATLLATALLIVGSVFVLDAADQPPPQAKAIVGSFPIRFRLDRSSTVTMVIEDAAGRRVRNLAADIRLPPGEHVLTWDGFDDGVDTAAGRLRQRVAPGTYRARGLTHDGLDLIYEFSVYHSGSSPWFTKDGTGAWMGDHAAPSAALFLPAGVSPVGGGRAQLLLGSGVGEAGHPLIWVDSEGTKLAGGVKVWGWYGAQVLARDTGASAVADYYAYSLFTTRDNDQTKGDLHLVGLNARNECIELADHAVQRDIREAGNAVSLAVRDGIAVMSYQGDDALVVVDIAAKRSIGTIAVPSPRGLFFASDGRLLIATGDQVRSFRLDAAALSLTDARTVIASGLEDPAQILVDATGRIHVTDRGASHQLKVFSVSGTLERTIGEPGGVQLGAYNERRMQNPNQVAIDDRGRYWVAEDDVLPKRISLWAADGAFVTAFYGPPGYGAGGSLDPQDRDRFYYQQGNAGGLAFALDWAAGTSRPVAVYHRRDRDPLGNVGNNSPQQPIHVGGRLYLTNSEVNFSYKQESTVGLWLMGDDRIARAVMVAGTVRVDHPAGWLELRKPAYRERLAGLDTGWTLFVWSDADHDGEVDPEEVQFRQAQPWERQWGPDRVALTDDLAILSDIGLMAKPLKIDDRGVPHYDLGQAEPMGRVEGELMRASDGTVLGGMSGWKDGSMTWSYPARDDHYPPSHPGEVVLPNRILGQPITPGSGEAGQIFAMNGYKGNIFLFTTDGLFLSELGGDMRLKPLWRLPLARGEALPPVSFEDEHFWPTLNRAADGTCYLVAGKEHSSILRMEGLETVRRRDFAQLAVTAEQLDPLSPSYLIPLREQGRATLRVPIGAAGPAADGRLGEWADAEWVRIDGRAEASVAVVADRLHVAWRTGDPEALGNAGGDPRFLFKKGGAVDLMIGADAAASRDRREPVPGDLRLLATMVQGTPVAVLYRAVVAGSDGTRRAVFDSPVGRVEFDEVADVSARITLARRGGDIELSIPLDLLGLQPEPEQVILADIGLLRGDGAQTTQRSYWNNQGATIVSDIPSEARLEPANWGEWTFSAGSPLILTPIPDDGTSGNEPPGPGTHGGSAPGGSGAGGSTAGGSRGCGLGGGFTVLLVAVAACLRRRRG